MNRWFSRDPFVFVVLLAVLVLGGWLGSRALNEPDEGRYAEIGREMALQQDWLIPHLNGVPHFQKPPLTYWLTASAIRLFGANEWAVRLTPALAAFGTFLVTAFIAGVLYGRRCRWMAGLILLGSMGFFMAARLITTDMLLTFCITASVAGLVGYVSRGQKAWLVVFYLSMGLGFLAKGPLGILLPAIAAVALQAGQRRQGRPVIRLYWGVGLPVSLLIGLSWYVALIHQDRTLFDYFFRNEILGRIVTNTHNRAKSVGFYPAALALGLVPWTGFAMVLLRDSWRRRREIASVNLWLFGGWIAVPYLLFTLVVSKLATYLLPLLPPLAILIARWFEHPDTGDRWRLPARLTVWTLIALLTALPAVLLLAGKHPVPIENLSFSFWTAVVLALVSFLFLGHALGKGLSAGAFLFWKAATWGGVMLAMVAQTDMLMPGLCTPVRRITARIQKEDPAGIAPVFVFQTRANGTEFYLRRLVYRSYSYSDVVRPLEGDLLRRIVRDEPGALDSLGTIPAFIVTRESRYHSVPRLQEWRVIARDGSWMLLGSHADPGLP